MREESRLKLLVYLPAALSGILLGTVIISFAFYLFLPSKFVWVYSIAATVTGLSYTYISYHFKAKKRL